MAEKVTLLGTQEAEVFVRADADTDDWHISKWYYLPAPWILLITTVWFGAMGFIAFLEVVPGWNIISDRHDYFLAWAIGSAIAVVLLLLVYVWYLWSVSGKDSSTEETVWVVNSDHIACVVSYLVTVVSVYVIILILLWRFDDEYGNSNPYNVSANPRRFVDFIANMVITFLTNGFIVYTAYVVLYNHMYPMMKHYKPTPECRKIA